jgi:uncharacterized membrane protein
MPEPLTAQQLNRAVLFATSAAVLVCAALTTLNYVLHHRFVLKTRLRAVAWILAAILGFASYGIGVAVLVALVDFQLNRSERVQDTMFVVHAFYDPAILVKAFLFAVVPFTSVVLSYLRRVQNRPTA